MQLRPTLQMKPQTEEIIELYTLMLFLILKSVLQHRLQMDDEQSYLYYHPN